MNITAIIQARMGSTRLPGKIMKKVNNKPLLEYQLERIKRSKVINNIIIATTNDGSERPIVELANKMGIDIFKGSESNVLERYYLASKEYRSDIVVRITSDCPIIDPAIIDSVIKLYLENNYDYVSNTQVRTFPRGMDTEVFSFACLEKAYQNAEAEYEKEHVTPYLYLNPKLFSVGQYTSTENNSLYRLTVDTREDFELISIILSNLYPENHHFSLQDVLQLMKNCPELIHINKHVEQKKLKE